MGVKTLQEWQEIYEKKAHEKFELEAGFHLFYLPNRGFACLSMDREQGVLIISQVCGDGEFWLDFITLEAESQQLPRFLCYTERNIKAFLRTFKITGFKDGYDIQTCRDKNGKKVIVAKHGNGYTLMFCHTETF